MNHKCLTEEEEIKVERLSLILHYLGKSDMINFVVTGPYRFTAATGAFTDKLTDRIIAPNENMIDLFYKRLCRDAMCKLEADLRRSKIKGLRKMLVFFFKLDFLPLAF